MKRRLRLVPPKQTLLQISGRGIWPHADGGGVKGGMTLGATDELGVHLAERPVYIHDLQATILHLLGLDHERLTFRHGGRDYRLTDVHGKVVKEVLA